MPKKLKLAFWAFIAILIAFNIFRFYQKDWNYADPIDYRGLYLGSLMMQSQENLYNDSIAASKWQNLKSKENFESNSDFGDKWVSIMLYPPQAFVLPFALSKLNWKKARIAWWIVCILSLILVAFLLHKSTQDANAIWLLLAFKGTFFAVALGNPVLLVVAFLFLSIHFKDSRPVVAGLFLAFAMLKFNLAIPVGLWFLFQKKFKLLSIAALGSILLLLPSLIIYDNIITDYLSKVNDYYKLIYEINIRNIYTFSDSELSMMLNYYFPQDVTFWKNMNSIAQLSGYVFIALLHFKKKISLNSSLIGLLLVSFLFSYHLVYDAMIFILPIFLIQHQRTKIIALVLFLILSLPINALLPNFSFAHFHYPIIIGFALLLFIFASIKNKIEV